LPSLAALAGHSVERALPHQLVWRMSSSRANIFHF
jgi:hypothetical protein